MSATQQVLSAIIPALAQATASRSTTTEPPSLASTQLQITHTVFITCQLFQSATMQISTQARQDASTITTHHANPTVIRTKITEDFNKLRLAIDTLLPVLQSNLNDIIIASKTHLSKCDFDSLNEFAFNAMHSSVEMWTKFINVQSLAALDNINIAESMRKRDAGIAASHGIAIHSLRDELEHQIVRAAAN